MTKSTLTNTPSMLVSSWLFVQNKLDALAAVAFLVARLYIAKIFFYSGLSKIKDWETTLYLFREEYQVPLISPEMAAVMGTAGELGLAVLLAIGLFTRFAACGLFVLNIIAVASYYNALKDSPVAIQDHIEWGIVLALLMTIQVQKLTLDYLVKWKAETN